MEEIIKILEEHNIKCVWNGNDLSLSHKNFYIEIEDIIESRKNNKIVRLKNKKIVVNVFYKHEVIHVTVY